MLSEGNIGNGESKIMKFGEKLRKNRQEANYTQEELAEQLGVTCRTLQNYESGSVYPKKRELYSRLVEVLGHNVDYWVTETNDAFTIEKSVAPEAAWSQAFKIRELFLQGDMTEQDLDDFMRIVQDAYWRAKDQLRGGSGY